MLLGLIAIILILIFVVIWLNVFLVRRNRDDEKPSARTAKTADNQSKEAEHDRGQSQRGQQGQGAMPSTTGMEQVSDGKRESSSDGVDGTTPADDALSGVEVVHEASQGRATTHSRLFTRQSLPYILNETVPRFGEPEWQEYFLHLTEDRQVMGWIAFHEDIVGASDTSYDAGFIEVLRAYRRAVSKLQREVGLSHVMESSIVGDEGKIWFVTGTEDVWFALFVDRDADVDKIAAPVVDRLLTSDTDHDER